MTDEFFKWMTEKGGRGSGFFARDGHVGIQGHQGGSAREGSGISSTVGKIPKSELMELSRFSEQKTEERKPENVNQPALFDVGEYTVDIPIKSDDVKDSVIKLCGIDKASGLSVVHKETVVNSETISMDARIVDKDGKEVGEIRVTLNIYDEGEDGCNVEDAHLDLIKIDGTYQDSGFGTRWVEHFENYCEYMGANSISLEANIDVGGYYWARVGYDFGDRNDKEYFIDTAHEAYNRYSKRSMSRDKFIEKIADKDDGEVHAWNIANLKTPDGTKIGKNVLLGSRWNGYKYYSDDENGKEVGEIYYSKKRREFIKSGGKS